MKLNRLNGRKTSDYLLRKGNVWKGKTMMIRWLAGAPRHPNVDPTKRAIYVGTFASTKLDKSAVRRNRMRRRCREALRTAVKEHQILPTAQLLISPRSASLDSPFEDIQADISAFLSVLTHHHGPRS